MTTSKKDNPPSKQTNQNTQINEKDKTIDQLTSEKSQLTSGIETKNEEIKKLTSEMKSIKLNNKGLVVTISIIIVFFSFLLFIEYKELKVKEASLGTNTLLDSLNFSKHLKNPDKMDLEQQVINYQFALSYYEYNNNLALHRTAMTFGAIMFFIGCIQILFVTVVKDVKTDDYFALNTIFTISLPGFFLALLGAFIIALTLLLTPSLNHDYSPKFLNSQVQKEFYKFNPPYLNKAARQPLDPKIFPNS